MPRISRPLQTGSKTLVVFLLAALVLTGALAYQAQDAARSHRQSAEQALEEYAALAAWEFSRHADMTLTAMEMLAFNTPATQVEGSPATASLASLEDFARGAQAEVAWCECMDSVRTFFRFDLRDGSFAASSELSPELREWLVRPIRDGAEAGRLSAPVELEIGQAPTRQTPISTQTGAYVQQSRRFEIVFETVDDEPRSAWYYLAHDDQDRPLALYGFEAPPSALVGTVFRRIIDQTPLLPESLTGSLPNDSLLSITIRDRDGSEIFRSSAGHSPRYVAADTVEAPFEELVVEASLRPSAAGDLLIGGLPGSRLPLLLALLGLAAGLIAVALIQLRRHQELARLRTDFVAGVSHELRTPLAQIRLYAELLRSGRLRSEEERERSLRVIDQEARRLSYLVENVLRFSPAEGASLQGRRHAQRLAPLVREILDDFAPLARARRAQLHAELDDDVAVPLDTGAFRQVLLNLLDNAVKYGPAGQRIRIGLERSGSMARLWVEDEGPGIPEAERQRVWEPYRRLDDAVESGMGGSGIGLSVVRELVDLHGGRARVSDAAGGGARFVVELPAAVQASDSAPELVET